MTLAVITGFLVIGCMLERSQACIECKDFTQSLYIDPNKFETEATFSVEKLFNRVWYEHLYWAESTQGALGNNTWFSYAILVKKPSKSQQIAEAFHSGKDGKQCLGKRGPWTFNPKNPLRNFMTSAGNYTTSNWMLDTRNEEFLLIAKCVGTFKTAWSGLQDECPDWSFTLFYKDSRKRSNEEYNRVEKELEKRICFPARKLARVLTYPSNDCISQLPKAAAAGFEVQGAIIVALVAFARVLSSIN